MSEEDKKDKFILGKELEGDLPADAEVVEGQKPSDPEPTEDVEGRHGGHGGHGGDHHGHHGHVYWYHVTCPYHDCHACNRVASYVHWCHCWCCHRNFHV